ncbi:MAG: hypothetical protein ABR886_09375 [Dehalococcoidales bacterium]|jgi:hypothetical protein
MKLEYVLYGFGVFFCVAGLTYLAAEYVKYLSDAGRIGSLLLTVGLFAFLGKFFEELGW